MSFIFCQNNLSRRAAYHLLKSLLSITIIFLGSLNTAFGDAQINDNNTYLLSSDDAISISVFKEPDLSLKEAKIAADGSISMPLLGPIKITGLTVKQVETVITNRLLDGYLKKPSVTVYITEYRPFYINGEVEKPGSYAFRKNLTVRKAITLAGGFTERASRSSIKLIREGSNKERRVRLTDSVKPGDIITVNESFF